MSIEKVVKVANVGRLTNLTAAGDVTFKPLTLIWGTNGNGKTTLASILRSLKTGDSAHIDERATLGAKDAPSVEILLSDGLAHFRAGAWDKTVPELEIFDSAFVNENVYTGDRVDPEHRKNLYQVVVGDSAVKLAKQIDQLDSDGRATARSASELEAQLRQHIQAPFELEAFLNLQSEPGVDEKISEWTAKLNATRRDKDVLARPSLEALTAPDPPLPVTSVLAASVERIAEDATRRVEQHLQTRLGRGGEQWVRSGLAYLRDDQCPFCGQDIAGVDLVTLFRRYFSDTYNEHVVAIQRAINELQQTFGDDSLSRLTRRVMENDVRIAAWADLAALTPAHFDTGRIEATWRHMREVLLSRLQEKLAQAGLAIAADPTVEAAMRDYGQALADLRGHNLEIEKANDAILRLKKQAAASEAPTLEAELRRLRNTQIRQEPAVAALCEGLAKLRGKKLELEEQKRKVRGELEQQAAVVLTTYQQTINELLRRFGADFEITGTKPSFVGGKASSTYQLAINNVAIEIGDAKTPRGKPCFRTALSAGDKSTLALAFFIARLHQDAALSNRVVVFDDPLSSLDCFRVACTQQEIRRIAAQAQQVVVLSHEAFFLKGIHDCAASPSTTKTLQFTRKGKTRTLEEWKIKEYFLHEAHRDFFLLRTFLDNGLSTDGDLVNVARSIRPYLEGHLRYRYPDEYGPSECLGDFTDRIRKAVPPSSLASLQAKADELAALNEYARRFHHPGQVSPPVTTTETELRAYIQRALAFAQGGVTP